MVVIHTEYIYITLWLLYTQSIYNAMTVSDIESTGSHTEFFDKFGIRYQISVIYKTLWENGAHKAQFIRTAR